MKLLSFSLYTQRIKKYALTVYYAARDPRTPWFIKLLAFSTLFYVVCPIDFVPDFIPLSGILDDFILAPLSSTVVLRFVSSEVVETARNKAESFTGSLYKYVLFFFFLIILWIMLLWFFSGWILLKIFN